MFADFTLQIDQVSATRNYRKVFSPVTLTLKNGDSVYIEGENGAGKTTFLRVIAGLNSIYQGNISFNGLNRKELAHTYHRHILYVGHALGLKDDLTAYENIDAMLKIQGIHRSEAEILSVFETLLIPTQNRAMRYLSAGQRRRVALSRLWLEPKAIWILDEPFTALDKRSVAILEAAITEHHQQNGAILFTSHQTPSEGVYNKHEMIESYRK
ncbi:heme ABC exporter ATP-binding protein CcmA [Wohlfahrtiimonas chitiniclastica]|uniref:cytochrome c biogenesis heme-transporting ATPase CcmA n=1 Tax=Wohlfahrtiimonas chitiniclastica TaxID=400946 RepID=UPI000B99D44C|nr:cytochrome c biogenesis heme-transporting ATPase CcmA [Wohlfahrtiimonas chitiniclastica]OYQ70016.1 heme ABC exporter ATP-binding protein CcmA [Wohlfahrtiimonas chitiniclastica]OYQ79689.1 heme ABC exporter ATP-binding protein CcmA [Wohlfahrtiimonas chitiniclastica]